MQGLLFLVEAIVRFWRGLTLRRVLYIVAILAILAFVRELAAISDVAFLLGLDWGLTLEVFGAMMILAARTHAIATACFLRHNFSAAKRRAVVLMRRGVTRARRKRPAARPMLPKPSSDEDGPWTAEWSPACA